MLIFFMYLFAFTGIALLLTAAVLKLKYLFPGSDRNRLIVAISLHKMKFPMRFITPSNSHIISLNESTRTVAIGSFTAGASKKAASVLLPFEDIAGCEIVENALTLTKVSRTSRISRSFISAVPGGAAVAGNGAIYSTADKSEVVKELVLKIYINRPDLPSFHISFLPGFMPISKTDARYTRAFSELIQLHTLIHKMISP